MEKTTITIFIAQCGKKYQTRSGCMGHERNCKCFTNPKFKACHSCAYNGGFIPSDDLGRYRDCKHPLFDYDRLKPFNIPNTETFDCINCPFYKPKNTFTGTYEKWVGFPKPKPEIKQTVTNDFLPF